MVGRSQKRTLYSTKIIETLTKSALRLGVGKAVVQFNNKKQADEKKIHPRIVKRWVKHYETCHSFYTPRAAGRRAALNGVEKNDVLTAVRLLRSRKLSKSVSSTRISAITRGVIGFHGRPCVLTTDGGSFNASKTWCKKFMRNNDVSFKNHTTDRTAPDDDICSASIRFIGELQKTKAPLILHYNSDEFRVMFDPQGRGTWHPNSADKTVAIATSKKGCTCTVTTNPFGLSDVQLIWHGKTERCGVLNVIPDPIVWQDHQAKSHFQNANTFRNLVHRIVKRVKQDRIDNNMLDQPAVWIIDMASQHNIGLTEKLLLEKNMIHVVHIEARMTHVYQPADQFIIPCIKNQITASLNEMWQDAFSTNAVNAAVEKMCTTSETLLRQRVYNTVRQAAKSISMAVIAKSWQKCGVGVNDPENQACTNLFHSASRCCKEPCECGALTSCVCHICGANVCFACCKDHVLYCIE